MQDFLAVAAGEMIFQVFPHRWQQSLNVRSVLYKLFFLFLQGSTASTTDADGLPDNCHRHFFDGGTVPSGGG